MEFSYPYLMIIFIYIIILFFRSIYPQNKYRSRFRFISAAIYILFFGFRGYIGTDWFNYNISFELTSWNEWLLTDYEVGFSILMKIFKFLGLNYFDVVLIITILQVYLLDKFLNKSFSNVVLPYIFLISLFPVVIIDLQRNFTSILLAMNALLYLREGHIRKFYFYIILAVLFHISAVFLFLIPFLNKKRFNFILLLFFFFFGLLIYFLEINFYLSFLQSLQNVVGGSIGDLLSQVTRDEEISYGISIGIIEKIFLFFIIIYFYRSIDSKNLIFINFAIIYIFIYLYFSTSQSFINRFSNLFMFGYIWFYCFIFNNIKSKLINIYYVFILLFCVLRTLLSYNFEIYNYKNTIFEDENYFDRVKTRAEHYDK